MRDDLTKIIRNNASLDYNVYREDKMKGDYYIHPSVYSLSLSPCVCVCVCVCVLVAQSSLTLCDPMDCSPPSSSVHGIL